MNDNDFGFTFEESSKQAADELEQQRSIANAELIKWKSKCNEMHRMILPLLNNLKKNPDKPNIVWPDRVDKIDAFIVKLDAILKN